MATLTESQYKEVESAAPWLAKLCHSLLRQTPDALESYLKTVCTNSTIADTKAAIHCHFVSYDANGRPRINALAKAIADRVIDYCIPHSEFNAATKYLNDHGSAREWVKLERKAKGLFTDLVKSGEGGEMLLYVLIESILKAPQLLCKMPLKSSKQLHYNGADGIHGTVDAKSGMLALYWGEAKLHSDMTRALRECFKSVAPYLLQSGASASVHDRDLMLLRDHLDFDDPLMEKAILQYLDPDNPAHNKLQYRAACLAGFTSDAYPKVSKTDVEAHVKGELEAVLDDWRGKVKRHVSRRKLHDFRFEVFCLPFPSVDEFRKAFREELGLG